MITTLFTESAEGTTNPSKEGYEASQGPILSETKDLEDNMLQSADVTFGQRPVVQGESLKWRIEQSRILSEAHSSFPVSPLCNGDMARNAGF
jgi:hypothetical protein